MTGFKSKRAAALDEEGMYLVHQTAQQEPTLKEQLDKAGADRDKAVADWEKAFAELRRIRKLMEKTND